MNTDSLPESAYFDEEVGLEKEKFIGDTRAGKVYEKKLLKKVPEEISIPQGVMQILSGNETYYRDKRRILFRKLIRNAGNKFPAVGKPSSSFLFIRKDGKLVLHYLKESPSFDRGPVLHSYLRDFDEKGDKNYTNNNGLWSGHVANISPEYRGESKYSHMMLLDKFSNEDLPLGPTDNRVINALHANGIIPITADSHPEILYPNSHNSEKTVRNT